MNKKRFATKQHYTIVGKEQTAELTYSTNPIRNSVSIRPNKVTPKFQYMKK